MKFTPYTAIKSCEDCQPQLSSPTDTIQDRIWASQLNNKQIMISGEIGEDLIEKAVIHIFNFNQIDDANAKAIKDYERDPIFILINSPGGAIDEAFSLIDAIQNSATPVITIALGKAMSAAFLILLAGHQRMCQKYTNLMYHQGSGGVIDKTGTIMEYAEYVKNRHDEVEEYVADQTKIKRKKLKEIFNSKSDWFITPKDAKELGIVHEII